MMTVDAIRDFLNRWARPLLSKWLTRAVLYGAAAITAKLGSDTMGSDTGAAVGEFVASGVCAGLAMLVDWLHHRKDKAEAPAGTATAKPSATQ